MVGLFSKRKSGGLGRGVGGEPEGDREDVFEGGIPASETIIDADGVSGDRTETDDVLDAEVAEALRETAPKPSWRQRIADARASKKAPRTEVDDGADVPSKRGSRKARQAEKDAEKAAETDMRLSNMVMIDFYPGLSKEDAIETARHWAMTHMDIPSMCFYYVEKTRDGYAVEVQEGVGRAYLPSVMELATNNPGRIIVVPMVRRKLTVFYSARTGEFEAQVLPEMQDPPAMPENPPIQAKRSTSMTPVLKQHIEWLYAGTGTAIIGGLALLASLTFYALDPKSKVPPEWHTTEVSQLPVMQWNRLNSQATDSYVVRLEFQDGQWRIVRQSVTGTTVDVAPAAGPGDGTVPPGIPAPGADASGVVQGGAPGSIPPPAPDAGQAAGQDQGQAAPTNIPPPADAGGR